MNCQLATTPWHQTKADWLVIGIPSSGEPSARLIAVDHALGRTLTRLRETGDLTGKPDDVLVLPDAVGIPAGRVLLVGLGDPKELTVAVFEKAMRTAARQTSKKENVHVAVAWDTAGPLEQAVLVQTAVTAFTVGCVGQDLYRAEPGRFPFSDVTILSDPALDQAQLGKALERGRILGEAVNLTRELINRSPADIDPAGFANRTRSVAADCGLSCEVLDENRLQYERMGSMLAVAAGSDAPPKMVVLEHRGGGEEGPVLGLCGKGVTFDSGGLSLKTSEQMKTMKCDMSGAATVLGAMTAIARLKLPVNVIGFMGLTENMVNGSSYKLGDVLTARNGVTIEVLNTDAEGRLVLADVLSYAADQGVDRLIDLATLTGACVVALGEEMAGLFTNETAWGEKVSAAAEACGEEVWKLPLYGPYAELLKSDVADVKNIGDRWGGAITAAKFLEKFVADKPWVHLDIAGPAFASSNKPHREGGATGCMVRTLVETAEKFA